MKVLLSHIKQRATFAMLFKQLEAMESRKALQVPSCHHLLAKAYCSAHRTITCLPNMLRYIYDSKECCKPSVQHAVWHCQPLCIRDESAGLRRFILYPCGRVVYPLPFFWRGPCRWSYLAYLGGGDKLAHFQLCFSVPRESWVKSEERAGGDGKDLGEHVQFTARGSWEG